MQGIRDKYRERNPSHSRETKGGFRELLQEYGGVERTQ